MIELVAVLGLLAGALSTLAGQGGGLLAMLVLSALQGPHEALLLTVPGFALANAHRAWLFRARVHRSLAGRLMLTMVPTSLVVAGLALRAPAGLLRALLVVAVVFAVARTYGRLALRVPSWAIGPAGVVLGAFGASSAGAGMLLTPVLLAAGLEGDALVGTSAAVSFALCAGRLGGYAVSGALDGHAAAGAAAMAVGLLVGNALGHRARRWFSAGRLRVVELGSLVGSTALVVLGAR